MRNPEPGGSPPRSVPLNIPVEKEVQAELAFHFEMTIRELMERGMNQSQARAEAERRFGDAGAVGTECRRFAVERNAKVRRAEYRDELRQDIRFAVRQLLRSRGFTAVAVLTLALGIGATAAVFSALDAVVLRPLPFPHADRIGIVFFSRRGELGNGSVPEFIAMRNSHAFEHVAATVLGSGVTLTSGDVPEMIDAGQVTSEYFAVFNVQPAIGRTFSTDEDAPGGQRVAVLSHKLWMSHFNGDPALVGRALQLDGVPHTVIGIMPASFDLTGNSEDLWLPMAITPQQMTGYGEHFIQVIARLPAGVSIEQARSRATAAERALAEHMPERTDAVSDFAIDIRPFIDYLAGDYKSLLFILLGAVGFVLLISCTNVANLLLARGSSRAKELAIRAALGAGRGRLVRQLLTESLVLGAAGAVFGLGIGYALLRVILRVSPEDVPRLAQARIDWRVLVFTLGIALFSCLVFGLFPAVRSAGLRLQGTLREGGGGRRGGTGPERLRGLLVTAEVALAITLLVGSGLLIRSAWLIERVDPGFEPRGVLTARLLLPESRYPTGARVARAYAAIRDEASRIPGVRSAAIVSVVPLSSSSMHSSVLAEGQDRTGKAPTANLRLASSGYFATMQIPLLAGRDLGAHDDASSTPVVVINQALAKMLWPKAALRDVLGKRLDALSEKRSEPHFMEVVGIVANLHDAALSQAPEPDLYVPVDQTPEMIWPLIQRSLVIVLRATNPGADPEVLVRPLKRAVTQVDPSLPVAEAKSMNAFRVESLATARMNTLLLTLLGGIALVLAMVGIYGVVSYFVSQRTHEIGIRMALGATPGRIWQFVVKRGLTPITLGVVVGFGLSALTTAVLRGQLYRVSGHDPITFAAVGATLFAVGLVATYVPARRAMRVAPIVALND
jgi:putative ABC transport system permease protein